MSAWTYRYHSTGKAAAKIVPLRPRTPCWKGLSADSEEKREPVSDINTAMVGSLKVLDPKRPIREADVVRSIQSLKLASSRTTSVEWMSTGSLFRFLIPAQPELSRFRHAPWRQTHSSRNDNQKWLRINAITGQIGGAPERRTEVRSPPRRRPPTTSANGGKLMNATKAWRKARATPMQSRGKVIGSTLNISFASSTKPQPRDNPANMIDPNLVLPAVNDRPGVIERAFQLAKSGKVGNISDVRTQLAGEGYSNADIAVTGRSLAHQLSRMIVDAKPRPSHRRISTSSNDR